MKTATEVHFQADVQDGDVLFWLSDMGWIMAPWIIVGTHALGQSVVLYDGAPDHPGPDRLWQLVARHRIVFLGLADGNRIVVGSPDVHRGGMRSTWPG